MLNNFYTGWFHSIASNNFLLMFKLQSVIDKERRGDYLGKTVQVRIGSEQRFPFFSVLMEKVPMVTVS